MGRKRLLLYIFKIEKLFYIRLDKDYFIIYYIKKLFYKKNRNFFFRFV